MKSNNILTYLLYLLLAGLIVAAGYKACQIKKDKQLEREKQEAELQKALHDMGYTSSDTTASSGSTYTDSPTQSEPAAGTTAGKTTTTTASKNGIEDEPDPVPAKTVTSSTTKTGNTAATEQNKPAASRSSTLAPKTTTNTKSASKSVATPGPKNAKYRVQAGSFTKMEGARRRLEEVIKLGYPNAEIGKTNNGKFAVVVVYRTNDKADAIRVADKLEAKGVDASVMENDN